MNPNNLHYTNMEKDIKDILNYGDCNPLKAEHKGWICNSCFRDVDEGIAICPYCGGRCYPDINCYLKK